ncbi:MAG: hypothetical protein ABJ308_01830 [Halieaceae bacterium]
MEYMEAQTEHRFTYQAYPTSGRERERYDYFTTKLTRENYLENIREISEAFLDHVGLILQVEDERSGRLLLPKLSLDLYVAEQFFMYAHEGIPRFLMRSENGILREMKNEELENLYFDHDIQTMVNYNLFFSAPEDVHADLRSFALDVVLNKFSARIKLDHGNMEGQERELSIAEVALLAGMKEKSVRNASQNDLKTETRGGMTVVSSRNALEWLRKRRNFVESRPLENEACMQAFREIADDFFG